LIILKLIFFQVTFWFRPIYLFLRKELHQEFKRPAAFLGVLLYLVCVTFIVSLSTKGNINPSVWSALFWILMMFVSFNVFNKNLSSDEQHKWYYYYQLVHPIQFILARIFFHAILLWILGLINFFLLSLWIKNPIISLEAFLLNIFLGGLGFASSLTLISSIAVHANHPALLMSVLGFPLIIPLLWALIKVSLLCIQGLTISELSKYWFFLFCINTISLLLSAIFFPLIWKE